MLIVKLLKKPRIRFFFFFFWPHFLSEHIFASVWYKFDFLFVPYFYAFNFSWQHFRFFLSPWSSYSVAMWWCVRLLWHNVRHIEQWCATQFWPYFVSDQRWCIWRKCIFQIGWHVIFPTPEGCLTLGISLVLSERRCSCCLEIASLPEFKVSCFH